MSHLFRAVIGITVDCVTGAHHGGEHGYVIVVSAVSKIALRVGNDWNINAAKDVRNGSISL